MNKKETYEGIITFTRSGHAFVACDKLEKKVFITSFNVNKALNGDTVKIKIINTNGKSPEGFVKQVTKRHRDQYVGTFFINGDYSYVDIDNNKNRVLCNIGKNKTNGATHNQKVMIKLLKWDDNSRPMGEVIRIIGDCGDHETEINAIMEEHNLPYEFSDEVIEESKNIPLEITQDEIDKRLDLRHILTCGIDPYDSKDADDTIGVEWVDGEMMVYVNIADVTHYVKPDTLIDKEAYSRGTSVYLVDRCVPMLPENLSNVICSLKSGSDKLCFSAIFKFDAKGKLVQKSFARTIINVNKDYSYEEAQEVIENGVRVETKEIDQIILDLNRVAKILRKERFKNSILAIENPEIKFKLNDKKEPIEVIFKTSKDSNKLIEEFMLLANKEVAKFIKSKGSVCVNRVHESPNEEKLELLKNFVAQFGYEFNPQQNEDVRNLLTRLFNKCKGSLEEDLIGTFITRIQQKASYTTNNTPHFGLNFDDYSHFTSPIRRMSDIFTHRILASVLGNDGYPTSSKEKVKINPTDKGLELKCKHISQQEIKSQKASRDSIKYMQCIFLKNQIGKVFDAIVTSVVDYGLFINLEETHADCLIKTSNLDGNWVSDSSNFCIKEYNTGDKIKVGDKIRVKLNRVDIINREIEASLVTTI